MLAYIQSVYLFIYLMSSSSSSFSLAPMYVLKVDTSHYLHVVSLTRQSLVTYDVKRSPSLVVHQEEKDLHLQTLWALPSESRIKLVLSVWSLRHVADIESLFKELKRFDSVECVLVFNSSMASTELSLYENTTLLFIYLQCLQIVKLYVELKRVKSGVVRFDAGFTHEKYCVLLASFMDRCSTCRVVSMKDTASAFSFYSEPSVSQSGSESESGGGGGGERKGEKKKKEKKKKTCL